MAYCTRCGAYLGQVSNWDSTLLYRCAPCEHNLRSSLELFKDALSKVQVEGRLPLKGVQALYQYRDQLGLSSLELGGLIAPFQKDLELFEVSMGVLKPCPSPVELSSNEVCFYAERSTRFTEDFENSEDLEEDYYLSLGSHIEEGKVRVSKKAKSKPLLDRLHRADEGWLIVTNLGIQFVSIQEGRTFDQEYREDLHFQEYSDSIETAYEGQSRRWAYYTTKGELVGAILKEAAKQYFLKEGVRQQVSKSLLKLIKEASKPEGHLCTYNNVSVKKLLAQGLVTIQLGQKGKGLLRTTSEGLKVLAILEQ